MRFTSAWKITMISIEITARPMMPLLKTSRSPRLANWRGMNPSRARIDDRRGKSAKLVWAATTRIAMVAICRAK